MIKVPCKDCDKRHLGCHSTCEDYKLYKSEVNKVNDTRNKYLNNDYGLRESVLRSKK